MKTLLQHFLTFSIILLCSMQVFAQGVVISEDQNATADPSAILDVQSGDKGFLPPRMTTAEWNAIAVPADGLVVYDTDENKLFLYNGTEWVELSAAGSRWEADGDDIYRIDGNVGIGTINPSHPFHVETTASISGSRAIFGLATSGSGTTYGVWGESNSTSGHGVLGFATAGSGFTFGVWGESSSTAGRGVLGFATAGSGTTYGVFGQSSSIAGRGVYGFASAVSGETYGVYGHVSSADGYAGYFTGQDGSRNYFQRKVGIGTLTPNEMLEVAGNIHVSGSNRTIFNRTNSSLAFGTNNTERMRINANGNVGIGTINPSHPLHVETTASMAGSRAIFGLATAGSGTTYGVYGQSSSTSGLGVFGFANAGSGTTYGVYGQSSSTAGRGVYGLASAGTGTTYGVIGSVNSPGGFAGYFTGPEGSRNYFQRSVGIGTEMPNEMLEVAGNIHVSGSNRTIFNRTNSSLAFGTNNTERMRITSGGNVGIGTSAPVTHLEISKPSPSVRIAANNASSSFLQLYEITNGNPFGFQFEYDGSDDKFHLWSKGFSGNDAIRMTWLKDGNVGIGTTNPSERLHVEGNICYTGSMSACSDVRYKTAFTPLNDILPKITSIGTYTYRWKLEEYPDKGFDDRPQIGIIAQEIEDVFPEMIITDDDGYLSVDYSRLSVLLLAAIQEQQEIIDILNSTIGFQQEQSERQSEQLDVLMTELADIRNMLQYNAAEGARILD